MINFIICEDEDVLASKYINVIDKFMMNNDAEYKIHRYTGYTKDWEDYVKNEKEFKIYILDIKTKEGSGIDAARKIREEFDDWVSMIIIVTAYSEYKYEAMSKRLMLVDFINKLYDFEQKLQEALLICMKHYNRKFKSIKYNYRNVSYNIELRYILYIEKEPGTKRSKVKTVHGEFYIQGPLDDIMKQLDKRFRKCGRSLIINIEQVERYNTKSNTVIFNNNERLTSVPREKRKELERYVRGLD